MPGEGRSGQRWPDAPAHRALRTLSVRPASRQLPAVDSLRQAAAPSQALQEVATAARVEDVLAIAAQMSSGGPTQLAHLVGAQLDASESYDSHSHRRRNGKLRRGRHRHANHPCTSITASTSSFLEEDSDLSPVLSTEPLGSPVTPEPFGDVTLAGSGNLLGAYSADTQARRRCAARSPPVATTVPDVRELDHGQPAVWSSPPAWFPGTRGRHHSRTPRCFISRRPPAPLPVAGTLSRCCFASNLFRDVT